MTDPDALTDEEILAAVRAYAADERLPPPATSEAADAFEAELGAPMPALLRRIYCEAANGGFGVDGAVLSLTDTGDRFSDEESLGDVHRHWSDPPEGEHPYPGHIVPLATVGCAIWWFVDLRSPEGRMWGWDPNAFCPEHRLFAERFTLAQWLTDWLRGNRALPRPSELPDCPDC